MTNNADSSDERLRGCQASVEGNPGASIIQFSFWVWSIKPLWNSVSNEIQKIGKDDWGFVLSIWADGKAEVGNRKCERRGCRNRSLDNKTHRCHCSFCRLHPIGLATWWGPRYSMCAWDLASMWINSFISKHSQSILWIFMCIWTLWLIRHSTHGEKGIDHVCSFQIARLHTWVVLIRDI